LKAIDITILLSYLAIAQWIIVKTKPQWLKDLVGPLLAAIIVVFMGVGIVEDSFVSCIIILPSFFYLILLSNKRSR